MAPHATERARAELRAFNQEYELQAEVVNNQQSNQAATYRANRDIEGQMTSSQEQLSSEVNDYRITR